MTAWGIKTAGEEIFNASQPTGRFGRPEDVVGLSLFLASPASAHVTGSHTILDGGSRFSSRIAPTAKLWVFHVAVDVLLLYQVVFNADTRFGRRVHQSGSSEFPCVHANKY